MADIKIYTLEEICDILSVTKRTIYNYIKEGKLQAFKMGKYWRVTEESFKAFIGQDIPIVDSNRRKENQERK